MEWSDTALVLRVGRFRETDLWIRLLTRQRGVISAFAFGGSRSRRRFPGCLDLLNVIHVRAKDSRGGMYLNLEEGSLLEGPRRLRQDWRRLGMLMNCVRFIEALGVSPDNADTAFALTRNMLTLFENAQTLRESLPVLYRLRLAADQGYVPDFGMCGQCGAEMETEGWFHMDGGMLACPACTDQTGMRHSADRVSAGALHALKTVQRELPEKWNTLDVSPQDWRACTRIADGFVQFHLGLSWENGRFRRH